MMYRKGCRVFLLSFLFFSSFSFHLLAADGDMGEDFRLTTIKRDFETYKGRELSLVLRFQYCDYTSKVISFYDFENINLQFEIIGYEDDLRNKKSFRGLSRGLYYRVRCRMVSIGDDGVIIADLIEFTPYRLEKIP
jgi:hypothetical protein